MSYETILVTREGRVGTITLNRPKALNALNSQLTREIFEAMEAYAAQFVAGQEERKEIKEKEAVGFAEWISKNGIERNTHGDSPRKGLWISRGDIKFVFTLGETSPTLTNKLSTDP